MNAAGQPIAGVVLAGGEARRFGGLNKALLPFADTTLAGFVAARLARQASPVGINANRDLVAIAELGRACVADGIGGSLGPLDGVLGAMRFAAANNCTHVVTVPVDAPFFPDELVSRLAIFGGTTPAFATSNGKPHPTFALWPVSFAGRLNTFLLAGKSFKMRDFLHSVDAVAVEFPPTANGLDRFMNINTPDDLAIAQGVLAEMPPSAHGTVARSEAQH
jgi:molybdenum cofactor guanylyltransferase